MPSHPLVATYLAARDRRSGSHGTRRSPAGAASSGPVREYAVRLLSQFDAGLQTIKAIPEKFHSTETLVEPLSQRELEVLQLIALGKTNKEIAQQLFLSLGTVKAHTASIYRKLDVAHRTEAVTRARQLGILP